MKNLSEYKLIATDFDDTLLNSQIQITSKTKNILNECKKYGYIIVGVTARTLKSSEDVVPLNLFDYLILNNGAYIYDVKNNVGKYIRTINNNDIISILNLVNNDSIQIDLVSGNIYYIYKNKKNSHLSFIKDINKIEEINEPIARMNIFLSDQTKAEFYNRLINDKCQTIDSFVMQPSNTDKKWIVVNPKGIDKSVTLENLGKKLNISLAEMIFFGDGINDLSVINRVGLGIAMGNALDEVKSKAKMITLTNNQDGVADYLEKNIMKVKKKF